MRDGTKIGAERCWGVQGAMNVRAFEMSGKDCQDITQYIYIFLEEFDYGSIQCKS